MKYNKIILSLMMGGALLATPSCIDADLEDALDYEDTYTNVDDADKHILGIYSEFMELAEQMVVLNELRGDLMTITDNANDFLQQVEAKKDNAENPYLLPTKYYTVINDCNDALVNFKKMYDRHELNRDDYYERYADITALRCYVYLQLGAQFGKVPYITTPIVDAGDMKAFQSQATWLDLDELIPRLIQSMEILPTLENYERSPLVNYNNAAVTLDGEIMSYYFCNKKLLLADLYLWSGRYRDAALLYKEIMEYDADNSDVARNYQFYRCNSATTNSSKSSSYYQAAFLRWYELDDNSFFTTWPLMFSENLTLANSRNHWEWIWAMTYTKGTKPAYPFIRLFESTSAGGDYQLRPSVRCIYNFARVDDDHKRTNGAPYDPRGLGDGTGATYSVVNGDTVCNKYLGFYNPTAKFEHEGRLWLYRAATVHLRFAECMNRLGYPEFAYRFIMNGIFGWYGGSYPQYNDNGEETTRGCDPSLYRNVDPNGRVVGPGKGHNMFTVMFPIQSGVCDNAVDSTLLYFDPGYMAANANFYTGYYSRGPWREHNGLRVGRAVMNAQDVTDFASKRLSECTTKVDSIYVVEKILMDEAALELAHEGNRFPDLVRVARRMNRSEITTVNGVEYTLTNDGMDGNAYMRAVIGKKSADSKNPLGTPGYTDESSWFLSWH